MSPPRFEPGTFLISNAKVIAWSFVFFCFHFLIIVYMVVCFVCFCLICKLCIFMFMYSYRYVYILLLLLLLLLLYMFCSGYSVSLFCSAYCSCVNVSTQLQLTKYTHHIVHCIISAIAVGAF